MRDPKRIPDILARLAAVWAKHPDLRLGQLIGNATRDDPYFFEDEKLITLIEQIHN